MVDSNDKNENLFHDIPKNYDEFIQFNNIDEWPFRLTSEKIFSLREELSDYQEVDFIQEYLKNKISIDLSSLNDLDKRIQFHEQYLMGYVDQIWNFDSLLHPKPDRKQEIKLKAFEELGEKVRIISDEVASLEKFKNTDTNTIHELNLKSVELYQYSGYNDQEFNDLPGTTDPMRLIHQVVKNTKIPNKYRHIFKKIFFSEASIGIICDMFWWLFLDYFKNASETEEKEKLFSRISLDYGLLLLSIPGSVKDGFLQIYPEQIALTLYVAFYHAFPDSRRLFGPDFKQKVVNICYLWMTGMHPLPNSFNYWPIDKIISVKENSIEEKSQLKSSLPKIKSHPTGPAFNYSKTLFDSKGCCPLIHKFLQLHEIEPTRSSESKCGHRLEVADIGQTETYYSQIQNLKEKIDAKKQTHNECAVEHEKEVQAISKRRIELEKRFVKLQQELNGSNSVLDMRHFVDQFVQK